MAPATLPRHAVIVTLDCDGAWHPGEPHDDGNDCFRRELECPGGDKQPCELWLQCHDDTCYGQDADGDVETDEAVRHGVPHRFFRHDGYWWGAYQPGACFYLWSDHTCDAISDLGLNEPGRYEIDVDLGDGEYPRFELAAEAAR